MTKGDKHSGRTKW